MVLVEQGHNTLFDISADLSDSVHFLPVGVVESPITDIDRLRIEFERRTTYGRNEVARFQRSGHRSPA